MRLSSVVVVVILLIYSVAGADSTGGKEVKVGVVVDAEDLPGRMTLTALRMGLTDFYAAHPNYTTRLLLLHRSSPNHDPLSSASAVLDLIKNEKVQAIIGPETSMEAQFAITLTNKAQIPLISFSATSPSLSNSNSALSYFIQATQTDSSQIAAIATLLQTFRWRRLVLVYVDNDFGAGIIPPLTDALNKISARIAHRSVLSPSSTDDQINTELEYLRSMDTRVFLVHMDPPLGARFFSIAKRIGMMSRDYAWIVTSGMANLLNVLPRREIHPMEGVIGVRNYFPSTPEVEDFVSRWKRKIVRENVEVVDPRVSVYQIWAYDAITALARSVEEISGSRLGFEKRISDPVVSVTELSTFGVSIAGRELIRAIRGVRFRGLIGRFKLIDGRLEASTMEIVNVVGNAERRIGFWTPKHGLVRKLNSANSTSNKEIRTIIWPGDSKDSPRGWVVSRKEKQKKLRVLVPYKDGYEEFVRVTPNTSSNPQLVTGYCIDIFKAVMASLPYPVQYEFHAYRGPQHDADFSYNELIDEVYFNRYDVTVGDVTIRANRSSYVDYSLPYTESGVIMVAPITESHKRKAWVFLMPLSLDLWVTSLCFFVFIAFVIWVLEHRINPQFRGPLVYQAGTSLYYSFSTMVFAHGQHVFSNAARFVVIVWIFLVLILTQCYTASLSSMLTVQQLQPTVSDVKELIRTGKSVAYQDGSFVKGLLIQMGFHESNLKSFKSVQDLDALLTNGSEKGGVAAAFDEIPYMNVFLATYCSKYVTVPPTYKTGGFGFVFPLGSSLVDDVSRRILNVTEGNQMADIEKKWFSQNATCLESSSTSLSSPDSLGLDSFSGLFLIAGCVAAFSLTVFFISFLYENRRVWLCSDPNITVWDKARELARIFDQRNMDSHTFRIGEPRDMRIVGSSHNSLCPPSPLSLSNHAEVRSLGCSNDQSASATPSPSPECFRRNVELAVQIPNV